MGSTGAVASPQIELIQEPESDPNMRPKITMLDHANLGSQPPLARRALYARGRRIRLCAVGNVAS
jgi:hypothetical protein